MIQVCNPQKDKLRVLDSYTADTEGFGFIYDRRDPGVMREVLEERQRQQKQYCRDLLLKVQVPKIIRDLTDNQIRDLLSKGRLRYSDGFLYPIIEGATESGLYTVTANGITTGTALKTIVELSSGANVAPTLFQWWCEFNGSAAAAAILVELLRATAAFTGGTTVTPTILQPGRKPVQSTALSGVAAGTNTTEGTRGSIIEQHYVPPTSGIVLQYPLAREPELAVSDHMRISCTAGAAVNTAVGQAFSE